MAPRGKTRPLVMGILNVTPDSFSDGGRYLRAEEAVAKGEQLVEEGADVVDVGGESTRPGATPVEIAEELRRVLPVIESLAGRVPLSIDTTKPDVARAAVAAGATLVNDVSGTLWHVAAELGVGWVSMHRRGTPGTMQRLTDYDVLVAAAVAIRAGVPEVWVDPGIGFAKTADQNLELLAAVPALAGAAAALDPKVKVLVGTSRKAFLGRFGVAHVRTGPDAAGAATAATVVPVDDRLEASLATAVWCMAAGADMVRVHDVAETVQAATIVGPARLSTVPSGRERVPDTGRAP